MKFLETAQLQPEDIYQVIAIFNVFDKARFSYLEEMFKYTHSYSNITSLYKT